MILNPRNDQQVKRGLPSKSKEQALNSLAIRSRVPPFRKRKIERIELLELPYFLFQVSIKSKVDDQVVPVAVDAFTGSIAVLEDDLELVEAGSSSSMPFVISRQEAREKIQREYRWNLLAAGLKRKRQYSIESVADDGRLLYPYWVGYFRKKGSLDLDVVDAISGMRQGSTIKNAIIKMICKLEG